MRPWRFATDNPIHGSQMHGRPMHASMRPWRFATDNVLAGTIVDDEYFGFNEAVAFCHG